MTRRGAAAGVPSNALRCHGCGRLLRRVGRELHLLREENAHLRQELRSLHGEMEHIAAGRFVASDRKTTFHRQDCKWAEYILTSSHLIEFASHDEAIAAGYRPCKTCCA